MALIFEKQASSLDIKFNLLISQMEELSFAKISHYTQSYRISEMWSEN